MLRKIFTAVALVLVLGCASAVAADAAQEKAIADAMAAMEKEPALSQADIDAFIALTPKMAAADGDQAAILKAYEESGLSPERLGVISTKLSLAIAMSQGMTREQLAATGQVPAFMIPSEEEAALIQKNMEAIMKAALAAQ